MTEVPYVEGRDRQGKYVYQYLHGEDERKQTRKLINQLISRPRVLKPRTAKNQSISCIFTSIRFALKGLILCLFPWCRPVHFPSAGSVQTGEGLQTQIRPVGGEQALGILQSRLFRAPPHNSCPFVVFAPQRTLIYMHNLSRVIFHGAGGLPSPGTFSLGQDCRSPFPCLHVHKRKLRLKS